MFHICKIQLLSVKILTGKRRHIQIGHLQENLWMKGWENVTMRIARASSRRSRAEATLEAALEGAVNC